MAGMYTPILSGGPPPPTASGTTYLPISCNNQNISAWVSTETDVQIPMPCAGTIDLLQINNFNSPGTAKSYAFTVRLNGADTALTATLTGSNSKCADTADSFTVAAGDLLSLKCVSSGTPSALFVLCWSVRFLSNSPNQSIVLGSTMGTKRTTSYVAPLQGSSLSSTNVVASSVSAPMPITGTFNNFYVCSSDVLATASVLVYLAANLTNNYSAPIASGSRIGNNTGQSYAASVYDSMCIDIVNGGNTTAAIYGWGIEFDPTENGYSIALTSVVPYVYSTKAGFNAVVGGSSYTTSSILYSGVCALSVSTLVLVSATPVTAATFIKMVLDPFIESPSAFITLNAGATQTIAHINTVFVNNESCHWVIYGTSTDTVSNSIAMGAAIYTGAAFTWQQLTDNQPALVPQFTAVAY